MTKSAILILTQNTIERKIYLKTSLYFLFRNFNARFKYPVIILHEGDYDIDSINSKLISESNNIGINLFLTILFFLINCY